MRNNGFNPAILLILLLGGRSGSGRKHADIRLIRDICPYLPAQYGHDIHNVIAIADTLSNINQMKPYTPAPLSGEERTLGLIGALKKHNIMHNELQSIENLIKSERSINKKVLQLQKNHDIPAILSILLPQHEKLFDKINQLKTIMSLLDTDSEDSECDEGSSDKIAETECLVGDEVKVASIRKKKDSAKILDILPDDDRARVNTMFNTMKSVNKY